MWHLRPIKKIFIMRLLESHRYKQHTRELISITDIFVRHIFYQEKQTKTRGHL